MKAIIWSKTPCVFCTQAKQLLKVKGIEYEERNITTGPWTVEQLKEVVPNATSAPQIFLDEQYIGGFDSLRKYFGI